MPCPGARRRGLINQGDGRPRSCRRSSSSRPRARNTAEKPAGAPGPPRLDKAPASPPGPVCQRPGDRRQHGPWPRSPRHCARSRQRSFAERCARPGVVGPGSSVPPAFGRNRWRRRAPASSTALTSANRPRNRDGSQEQHHQVDRDPQQVERHAHGIRADESCATIVRVAGSPGSPRSGWPLQGLGPPAALQGRDIEPARDGGRPSPGRRPSAGSRSIAVGPPCRRCRSPSALASVSVFAAAEHAVVELQVVDRDGPATARLMNTVDGRPAEHQLPPGELAQPPGPAARPPGGPIGRGPGHFFALRRCGRCRLARARWPLGMAACARPRRWRRWPRARDGAGAPAERSA